MTLQEMCMRPVSLLAAVGLLGLSAACGPKLVETETKVVILGFDGVDPDLIEEYLAEGRLPNLRRLREEGSLQPLGTTYPPESPVAWASFHTGMNPGKHGIYDFLRRDPKTYFPNIGTNDKVDPEFLFGQIPWRLPRAINLMQGTPFWKATADRGIGTVVLTAPVMFPPIELAGGYMTSGLNTPDIRGTQATYHYFSTDVSGEKAEDSEFGGKVSGITFSEGRAHTRILGPWDPVVRQRKENLSLELRTVRERIQSSSDPALRERRQELQNRIRDLDQERYIEVPLAFEADRVGRKLTVELQGQRHTVAEGKWSDWLDISFRVTALVSIHGICRFYPVEVGSQVRIYMSPIEMDPRRPPLPISYPRGFSAELAREVGLFKTRGWAAESAALKELKIGEDAFLEDLFEFVDKQEQITLYTLRNKPWSLFISVFEAPDRAQHMFWRLIDPRHPLHDPVLVEKYGDTIRRVYERMDETIGKVRAELGEDTVLIALSDHGFHSFRTGMNINTWLVENGFMFLKGQNDHQMNLNDLFSQQNFFINVDWTRTRAYSLGLGLIFINLAGRERNGVVQPGEEYERVKAELTARLVEVVDPATGGKVVDNVYDAARIYHGPLTGGAPDLIVGFAEGYRVSWQTALGAVPPGTLEVNDQKWSGDHCSVDAATTSGFIAVNRSISKSDPAIVDLAPTVLQLFGLPVPGEMDGKPLFLKEDPPKLDLERR
jgi:predicted AlkP superfamily phosphohydrolase/phosphomutase